VRLWRVASMAAVAGIAGLVRPAAGDVFDLGVPGETNLSFVTVGDPGNAADPLTGHGSVPYTYKMGTYDITGAQYVAMLNAVAQTDQFFLYNPSMGPANGFGNCGIIQSGSIGHYFYSVVPGEENMPINNISWFDAARFCNWLDQGQPETGVEDSSTTETGSYPLDGHYNDPAFAGVQRSPNAKYVIPSVDEWYKASFYKGGSTNAGYWLYPTQSNTPPSNVVGDGANNANFVDPVLGFSNPAFGLTPVGSFPGSPGPYQTFDMAGDVSEWTDTTTPDGTQRVILGGPYNLNYMYLQSSDFFVDSPFDYGPETGFRIAEVPEPASVAILGITSFGLITRRRK
jgi:sulfatase modifying factor 1